MTTEEWEFLKNFSQQIISSGDLSPLYALLNKPGKPIHMMGKNMPENVGCKLVAETTIDGYKGKYHGEVLKEGDIPHGVGVLVTPKSILTGNFENGKLMLGNIYMCLTTTENPRVGIFTRSQAAPNFGTTLVEVGKLYCFGGNAGT